MTSASGSFNDFCKCVPKLLNYEILTHIVVAMRKRSRLICSLYEKLKYKEEEYMYIEEHPGPRSPQKIPGTRSSEKGANFN
jgi:hypothetical protein